MRWQHIRDEIRRSLDAFGPARTLADVSLRAFNRLVMLKLMKGIVLDKTSLREPILQVDDPRYRFSRLDEETLRPFARTRDYELSEGFLREAFARGDECYGFLCDGELAAYTWYTTQPTQDAQLYRPQAPLSCMPGELPGLVLHFSDHYAYIYKGFTLPQHRGHRLHSLGMASALPIHLERGRLGMISYVDLTGYASRKSAAHAGFRDFGSIGVLRLFGRHLLWASRGCRPYEFFLEWVAPGSVPSSTIAAPQIAAPAGPSPHHAER